MRAWATALSGLSPIETVGNSQKSGSRRGCGYDGSPLPSTSRRNDSSCSSLSRPSRNARA